jgi:hypothetical protein
MELMAPKHAKRDAQMLHGQLVSGQIFAPFSPRDRETIWSVLRNVPGLNPSFFTFLADLNVRGQSARSVTSIVIMIFPFDHLVALGFDEAGLECLSSRDKYDPLTLALLR